MCDIGGTTLPATRNNDTSLTCNVNMNQVNAKSHLRIARTIMMTRSICHQYDAFFNVIHVCSYPHQSILLTGQLGSLLL